MTTNQPLYRRILIKISGEALLGERKDGIDHSTCHTLCKQIVALQKQGVEIAIVIGGGNIFRGKDVGGLNFDRSTADQIGMLATVINGLLLQQSLRALQCKSTVYSELNCPDIVPKFHHLKAIESLENQEVVIFCGGTGKPYFTTDTAAALKACEIKADALLKATKVDGIYDKDPIQYSDAKKYDTISYSKALSEDLKVMDATAFALCRENKLPIFIFNLFKNESLKNAVFKNEGGSLITEEK